MLQKTVETYPESADAHSLYAQVCRKFKAEEILIHGASNLSDLKGRSLFFASGCGSGGMRGERIFVLTRRNLPDPPTKLCGGTLPYWHLIGNQL